MKSLLAWAKKQTAFADGLVRRASEQVKLKPATQQTRLNQPSCRVNLGTAIGPIELSQ